MASELMTVCESFPLLALPKDDGFTCQIDNNKKIRSMNKTKKTGLFSVLLGSAMAISANAGEKIWDFETDPFEEFPFITSNQEDLVWGGQGWDDWVAEGNPGGFSPSVKRARGSVPLRFCLTLIMENS